MQILCSQPPSMPQAFAAVFSFCLPPVCTPPPTPSPKGRGDFSHSKPPSNSRTRKLFVNLCANSTLSLQISLASSVLVRGLLFTGKSLDHTACPLMKNGGSRGVLNGTLKAGKFSSTGAQAYIRVRPHGMRKLNNL